MPEPDYPFQFQLRDAHLAVRRHILFLQREQIAIPIGSGPLTDLLSLVEVATSMALDSTAYPGVSAHDLSLAMNHNMQLLAELEANSPSLYPAPLLLKLEDIHNDTVLGTISPMLLIGPGPLPGDPTVVTIRQAQLLYLEAFELSGPAATWSEGMARIRAKYGLGEVPYQGVAAKIFESFVSEPLTTPFEQPWQPPREAQVEE